MRVVPVFTYSKPPQGLGNKWKSALVAAEVTMARDWIDRKLPRHFTPAGGREYGYTARGAGYMRKKAARFHHQAPLRWGKDKLYSYVLGKGKQIQASPRMVTITIQVPPHWRKTATNPKTGRLINQEQELTAVSDKEAREYYGLIEERLRVAMQRPDPVVTTTA